MLIPYPHAVDNHQERNAQALVDAEAGEMILQADLTGRSLAAVLDRLSKDRKGLQQMAWNAGQLARPQAATEVVDAMYALAGRP